MWVYKRTHSMQDHAIRLTHLHATAFINATPPHLPVDLQPRQGKPTPLRRILHTNFGLLTRQICCSLFSRCESFRVRPLPPEFRRNGGARCTCTRTPCVGRGGGERGEPRGDSQPAPRVHLYVYIHTLTKPNHTNTWDTKSIKWFYSSHLIQMTPNHNKYTAQYRSSHQL